MKINDLDLGETDERAVSSLNSGDLGRNVIVTTHAGDNAVVGTLNGISFSGFRISGKLGRIYDVNLTVGSISVPVRADMPILVSKE